MKTFEDLEFRPWGEENGMQDLYPGAKHATLNFPNGYGVSVILAPRDCGFYSDGTSLFEVAVIKGGKVNYDIYDDVLPFQTKEEINKVIAKIQML